MKAEEVMVGDMLRLTWAPKRWGFHDRALVQVVDVESGPRGGHRFRVKCYGTCEGNPHEWMVAARDLRHLYP